MRWSELWHAQSVFFGAYYLPGTCPLVTHVANSYNKHYILNKRQSQPAKQTNTHSMSGASLTGKPQTKGARVPRGGLEAAEGGKKKP